MMNWVVSSSVLILIMIALRAVLKGKMSLCLQYGLWALVMVRLLCPFSIGETVMSIETWMDSMADTVEGQQLEEFVQTPLPNMSYDEAFNSVADKYYDQGIDIKPGPDEMLSESIQIEVQNTMRGGHTPEEIAKMVWLVGAVVIGCWFFFSNIRFSLKLRKERVLLGNIEGLCVYQTNVVETPCLYGIFTPAIYITDEVVGQDEKMRHVLEHECTHYRHRDYIWSVLRVVCVALHWYNPLVWCAAILSRNDAELACDEATIKRLGETERAAYGRTLIGLTCEKRPAILITATTMTGSGKSIKERIALIAKKPKMAVVTLVAVVVLAVLAIAWTYTGAKIQYANFSEWVETLDADAYFGRLEVGKGYGEDAKDYYGTKEEFEEFYELLKDVPEEKCYRRKQNVEEYERYYLYFNLGGEKEMQLTCLEDKTLLCLFNNEAPKFAQAGKKLIIDSPEVWNYIVDAVNEKIASADEDTGNDAVVFQSEYKTTADMNHDGLEDCIEVVTANPSTGGYPEAARIQIYLGKADGGYETEAAYTSDIVGQSHNINGAFVLTEKDGKDYLLYTRFRESSGEAWYWYSLMYFKETEMVAVETDEVEFIYDPYRAGYWDWLNREDVIPAFKSKLDPWIVNGTILVCYDIDTPTYISASSNEIPASNYYDLVWARNSDKLVTQYENEIGSAKWREDLYQLTYTTDTIRFIDAQLATDYSQWYREYDGSKLQRIDMLERLPNLVGDGGIPANSDVVYYRASAGENAQEAVYKMMEKMLQDRMVPDESRGYVITDYAILKQELIPIAEDMWMIMFLKGYYAFDGVDLVSMQEMIDLGYPVNEDGLVAFEANGSDDVFIHLLLEKDGVYRLQRLERMKNQN